MSERAGHSTVEQRRAQWRHYARPQSISWSAIDRGVAVRSFGVPYKGTGPASLALIGGEVQMGFNNVQTLLQTVQAGQLVALAVAEPKRMPALPDVPAVAETVPGFEMAPWVGIVA